MSFSVRFSDLTIDGILRWTPRRQNYVPHIPIPRRSGTLIPETTFSDDLFVDLSCEVEKDTENDLKSYFDTLGAKLKNTGKDRLYLRDDNRFLRAICTATAGPAFEAARNPSRRALYSLSFQCEPFWYSPSEEDDAQVNIASSPHQYVVTNNGKVPSPLRIEITAVGADKTDVKLTNSTTGIFCRYAGTIGASNTLVIDTDARSVQNNGVNDLNNFEGSINMELLAGQNNMTYTGPTGVDVRLFWSERFIF